MTLVVSEIRNGSLDRTTLELIVAAQTLGAPIKVVVIGVDVEDLAREISGFDVEEVLIVRHALLESYTADGYIAALAEVIERESPDRMFLAHTYQSRDFAPRLAAKLNRSIVTDCVSIKTGERISFVRPVFQGKLHADVLPLGENPHLITFQVGVFRSDKLIRGGTAAPVRHVDVIIEPEIIRQSTEAPFLGSRREVNLSKAERIVAVGRGIKRQEHLALAKKLAQALDAEIAASRPICDAGWLPMDRQVGSSGQTVQPKLYVALGISGAIQHLVGMKESETIVAVNKDREAPIFEVADYGVSGDLFEVIPALIDELED